MAPPYPPLNRVVSRGQCKIEKPKPAQKGDLALKVDPPEEHQSSLVAEVTFFLYCACFPLYMDLPSLRFGVPVRRSPFRPSIRKFLFGYVGISISSVGTPPTNQFGPHPLIINELPSEPDAPGWGGYRIVGSSSRGGWEPYYYIIVKSIDKDTHQERMCRSPSV
jgi:hypothetical protein